MANRNRQRIILDKSYKVVDLIDIEHRQEQEGNNKGTKRLVEQFRQNLNQENEANKLNSVQENKVNEDSEAVKEKGSINREKEI